MSVTSPTATVEVSALCLLLRPTRLCRPARGRQTLHLVRQSSVLVLGPGPTPSIFACPGLSTVSLVLDHLENPREAR